MSSSTLDLRQCDSTCSECVRQYAKKHNLRAGDTFQIPCMGIPKDYLPDTVLSSMDVDPQVAIAMLDPVTWAKEFLDWHCIDPDGEVWRRKTEDGSIGELSPYDINRASIGKSIYNRPYQATMLRCRSSRKVFRIGRQTGKSEALCIVTLHRIFTHSNFKVLVVAPFQSQIDLVFNRLMTLINSNPMLRNSVSRHVKAPNYQLELYNGSKVTGFTAGSKSGQGAASARGQTANMLVLDESDYLSAADVDACLATIINFADASVWMSSTPTGKRERFFSTCHSPLFKEFHYYSSVNPNWTEEMDQLYRENLTEEGYNHEILALFGEQEEGVYQVKYVEMAQTDYEYKSQKVNPGWMYTMGVDWNDRKIGVTIAVTGYDPMTKFFFLVDKCVVGKSEYTQLAACEKVAEYNRIWNPFSIYVDRGFGAAQVEVLTKFGFDSLRDRNKGPAHPDSKLASIVKAYDFGGTVEIHDLFTKQPIKKAAKPFLIENSVRRFETCTFKYPKSDTNFTAALQGYIVKRITQSGVPVYEEQNERAGDHFLDAVNLSLVAFTLEKTDFGKPKFSPNITFTGKLEESIKSNDSPRKSEEHTAPPSRTSNIQNPPLFGTRLPAAHTQIEASAPMWSWPGFGHDAPRPSWSSSQTMGAKGLIGRRPLPPRRKKF